jgi:hypothetical protein
MNSIEEMQVTGCGDCPFRDELSNVDDEGIYTTYYCKHPRRYMINLYQGDEGIITPTDCPLITSPITISLKTE